MNFITNYLTVTNYQLADVLLLPPPTPLLFRTVATHYNTGRHLCTDPVGSVPLDPHCLADMRTAFGPGRMMY